MPGRPNAIISSTTRPSQSTPQNTSNSPANPAVSGKLCTMITISTLILHIRDREVREHMGMGVEIRKAIMMERR